MLWASSQGPRPLVLCRPAHPAPCRLQTFIPCPRLRKGHRYFFLELCDQQKYELIHSPTHNTEWKPAARNGVGDTGTCKLGESILEPAIETTQLPCSSTPRPEQPLHAGAYLHITAVIFNLEQAPESPGGLAKMQFVSSSSPSAGLRNWKGREAV